MPVVIGRQQRQSKPPRCAWDKNFVGAIIDCHSIIAGCHKVFQFITDYPLTLQPLVNTTKAYKLDNQVFRPGINANCLHQAQPVIQFFNHYDLQVINPSTARHFTSCNSIRNYISGVRFLDRKLDWATEALDSFPVACLLKAADVSMAW